MRTNKYLIRQSGVFTRERLRAINFAGHDGRGNVKGDSVKGDGGVYAPRTDSYTQRDDSGIDIKISSAASSNGVAPHGENVIYFGVVVAGIGGDEGRNEGLKWAETLVIPINY